MTPTHLCRPIALIAFALTMASCAGSARLSPAAPPQLQTPPAAAAACPIYRLPDLPTQADLEVGYATRGAQVLACDAMRDLAVQTHAAEHALEARWAEARRDRERTLWERLTPWREP